VSSLENSSEETEELAVLIEPPAESCNGEVDLAEILDRGEVLSVSLPGMTILGASIDSLELV
jgi:hypothetical protein